MRVILVLLVLTIASAPVQARTWQVEKNGSGDFTILQDALDAAASGDSILIGPGRFDTFRPGASVVSGSQFQAIAWITTADLTLIGSREDTTTIGPQSPVEEVDGQPTRGLYVDGGAPATIESLFFENARVPVILREHAPMEGCTVRNTGTSWGVGVLSGDQIAIRNCLFMGMDAIITASSAVTGLLVEGCTFRNPALSGHGVVIGNGSQGALIRDCTFEEGAVAIQFSLSGTGDVEDCTFTGLRLAAIDLSSGGATMRRCRIEAGAEFPLGVNIGRLDCYDSVVGGASKATILTAGDMTVRNCHILNGGALSVDSRGSASRVVDLAGNWWGTADPEQVASIPGQPPRRTAERRHGRGGWRRTAREISPRSRAPSMQPPLGTRYSWVRESRSLDDFQVDCCLNAPTHVGIHQRYLTIRGVD